MTQRCCTGFRPDQTMPSYTERITKTFPLPQLKCMYQKWLGTPESLKQGSSPDSKSNGCPASKLPGEVYKTEMRSTTVKKKYPAHLNHGPQPTFPNNARWQARADPICILIGGKLK